jgi:hypothetical protein
LIVSSPLTPRGSVHMTQDTCGKKFLPSQF